MTVIVAGRTTSSMPITTESTFAVGAALLDTLARRDLDGIAACLAPSVRFRALLPSRDVDLVGPDGVVAEFRRWFGSPDDRFELVDASVAGIGPRLHLRWVVRMSNAAGSRLVEQDAFLDADGSNITTIRLLCSGFVTENRSEP